MGLFSRTSFKLFRGLKPNMGKKIMNATIEHVLSGA